MFNPLSGGDQGKIGRIGSFSAPSSIVSSPSSIEAHHRLAGLRLGFLAEHLEHLAEALDMPLRLHEVLFKGFFELGMMGRLRHLGQGARQLSFGMEEILQLFDE